MENPDHYKYMPPAPGEREEHEEAPVVPEAVPEAASEGLPEGLPEGLNSDALGETGSDSVDEDSEAVATRRHTVRHSFDIDGWRESLGLRFLYALMSPLLVPSYATLCLFLLTVLHLVAPGATTPYTLTVLGATGVVPLIVIYVLLRAGLAGGFNLGSRAERVVPYLVYILALGAVTLFFLYKGANPWIWTAFCGGTAAALADLLLNFKWRVSTRCSAMAALFAVLLVIEKSGVALVPMFWWMVGCLFFCGLAGTLAIVVGRHSLREVLMGYATGFLGVILFSLIH